MALLQTLHLAHLPSSLEVHVGLFQDVQNAGYLRQQLLNGNGQYEYAFIDADVIVSTTHALAGVFRAANDYGNERIRSRNVHSEIVFALGPNNNVSSSVAIKFVSLDNQERSLLYMQIAESFRRFGVSDLTTNLLVIKLSTSPEITSESVKAHLEAVIQGKSIQFCNDNLGKTVDVARVRKIYKLNSPPRQVGRKKQEASGTPESDESTLSELEMSILGLIALKGAG
ncbi:hypothetical protein MMC07_005943 [Pseudocyphellaria aurata]|nr:hypothetical protein [Pseudocyphellaria aurata]